MSTATPTGRYSVFSLPREWFAACFSHELRSRPLARTVHGTPLALFRDRGGGAVAVLDRCAHRNVPLSLGRCVGGQIECAYHGWRYGSDGECRAVPGLAVEPDANPARRVPVFPVVERDGIVWTATDAAGPVRPEPPRLPHLAEDGYATVRRQLVMAGPMLAAIENALDVPHTSFLHRGLLRGRRTRVPVEAIVRHIDGGVEAVFVGEPRPPGIAARLLSPAGGEVEHVDRFLLPSLSQVEYRLGPNHLVITTAFTPIDDFTTALHATVTFRTGAPSWLVHAAVSPVARHILAQDARIVRAQADNVRRFGGERFASTPIDVLGPHILRLLRRAERNEPVAGVPAEERVVLYT